MLRTFLLILGFALPCSAQLFTVMVPLAPSREEPLFVHIDIPAGKSAEFINLIGDNYFYLMVGDVHVAQFRDPLSTKSTASNPVTLVGPLTVSLKSTSTFNRGICTYRLSDNPGTSGPPVDTFVPSNSVVVPANSSGNVQIMLESSVDLVTWTAANPGSYSSTTQSRFFRVRAVAP